MTIGDHEHRPPTSPLSCRVKEDADAAQIADAVSAIWEKIDTTLAHQMMFALATPQRPAIYFTMLGEPPLKMLRYQQQFDSFDSEAINRSVHFTNLSDEAIAGDLDKALHRIVEEVTLHKPALVFVDSFRSVVFASEIAVQPRKTLQQFIQQLGMLMTSWQATTFLIGEYFTEADSNPVFTVSDGLICLRQSVQRNSMVRKMEIMKMRGQPALPGLHTFRISKTGLQGFAPGSGSFDRRDRDAADGRGQAPERNARRHRFALGF